MGSCEYRRKYIRISKYHIKANEWQEIEDTMLHEIAHALTPDDAGHGRAWKQMCVKIGARPNRVVSNETMIKIKEIAKPKYMYACPNCNHKRPAYRKLKREMACSACCNKYNGGKYHADYKLVKQ